MSAQEARQVMQNGYLASLTIFAAAATDLSQGPTCSDRIFFLGMPQVSQYSPSVVDTMRIRTFEAHRKA